jgi:hypothetical protein
MLGKLGQITPKILREISKIGAEVLNWSDKKTKNEINRFADILRKKHKMNFNSYIGEIKQKDFRA